MSKHNLELLVEAARLLKPLLGELVFVGGSTTALLITDKAAAEVRPTYDVVEPHIPNSLIICTLANFAIPPEPYAEFPPLQRCQDSRCQSFFSARSESNRSG
jgi:hypothetical protein